MLDGAHSKRDAHACGLTLLLHLVELANSRYMYRTVV